MERNILFREAGNGIAESSSNNYLPNKNVYNENHWQNKWQPLQYETPKISPGTTIPKKISDEVNSNGYTCYINIDLELNNKSDRCYDGYFEEDKVTKKKKFIPTKYVDTAIATKTAIFAPKQLNPAQPIDIIVYLHGHLKDRPGVKTDQQPVASPDIEKYLTCCKSLALTQTIAALQKNIILVAPTLGPRSQYGNLVSKFDSFIEKIFLGINEYVLKQRKIKGSVDLGRLIIASHSGGGGVMLQVALSGQRYAKRANAFVGLDSWYQTAESWIKFANSNSNKKVMGCYSSKSGTAAKTGARLDVNNPAHVKNIPKNLVVIKGEPDDHFGLIMPSINHFLGGATLKQTPAKKKVTPTAAQKSNDEENKITAVTLSRELIVVGKHYEKEKVKGKTERVLKATIKEAPADFLPAIVKRAIGTSGNNWFNNFTRISFLGRKFKEGQYIHAEFAKVLKEVEKKFAELYGGATKDAAIAGNFLLGRDNDKYDVKKEGLSGSRKTSATATFSMHMFGLAVDVNYLRNPFIEAGDINIVNKVAVNAGLLVDGAAPEKYFHGMGYDGINKLDKLLEKYFDLTGKPTILQQKLKDNNSSAWKDETVDTAAKKINNDLKTLAKKLARGDNKEIIKKGGILDLPKEFVEGMIKAGLNWGGFYGDMMHFDMRDTGVGKKIDAERKKYQAEKNAAAKKKYLETKTT
jgi:hypothetical protein